jgi:starch synthase
MAAVQRANTLFRERAVWLRMMRQAMTRDFSWAAAARRYVAVYRELRPNLVSSVNAEPSP